MRLNGWDYSTEGMYFLTICAKERRPFFSQVVGFGILDAPFVQLTKYGDSVQRAMLYLSEHIQNVNLEKWVIMPNHVHVLIRVFRNAAARQGCRALRMVRFLNLSHH